MEYGLTDIQEYYANTGALVRAAQVCMRRAAGGAAEGRHAGEQIVRRATRPAWRDTPLTTTLSFPCPPRWRGLATPWAARLSRPLARRCGRVSWRRCCAWSTAPSYSTPSEGV